MPYRVKITHKPSGLSAITEHPYEWSDYLWLDGNYSCDCNRGIFLAEAVGESAADGLGEWGCGDGEIFSAEFVDGDREASDGDAVP